MARPSIRVARDAAGSAAALVAERLRGAVAGRGRAWTALAGGSTPRALYERLVAEHRDDVPWPACRFVPGDERPVPPDHPDSNWGMAWDVLLSRLPVEPGASLRFGAELEPPAAVAERFERALRAALDTPAGELPRLDLVLLGLGEDGHTASLFPGSPALDARGRLAVANPVPSLGQTRYTLTADAINAAACVVFFVTGAAKAATVAEVLEGPLEPARLPAQSIAPRDGELIWVLDDDAAARLERS